MDNVLVMMSTYNGKKYLNAQIESILNQKNVNVKLLVRDDGSTDGTISILEQFINNKSFSFYSGSNLGYKKSFMNLLSYADSTYDYYAFADQDDVWLNDKLESAIKYLNIDENEGSKYDLYTSNLTRVDAKLRFISQTKFKNIQFSVKKEVCHHKIPGCTFVFRKELFDKVKSSWKNNLNNCSHDEFVTMMCLLKGGKVLVDNKSHILFRRHSNNASVDGATSVKKIWKELSRFHKTSGEKGAYAKDIYRYYSREIVNKEDLEIIKKFSDYQKSPKNTIGLFFSNIIDSGYWWYDCYLRLLILCHRF